MIGIQANDYFIVPLLQEFFKFENSNEDFDLKDSQGEPAAPAIGKWTVENNEVVATLNSVGANKNNIKNGYFMATGTVLKSGNNVIITASGLVLPPIDILPDDDLTEVEEQNFSIINKNGNPIGNKNQINWGMFVNYENYKKAYEGQAFTPLNNVMLTDDLVPGQTIYEPGFEIEAKIHIPTSEGKMSKRVVIFFNITEQFDKITANDEETYEDFYDRIKGHNKLAYGFHNGNKVIINFENLSGDGNGIKLNHLANDVTLLRELQNRVIAGELTQQQADFMYSAYNQRSTSNGDQLGFVVNVVANVSGGTNDYNNTT